MSVRYGTFTTTKITMETENGEVVIDRAAQVTLADRSIHGDESILAMLRDAAADGCDMVLVIGVEMDERRRHEGRGDAEG